MDRKTGLAIALCFLIFVGWQKFYMEPRTVKPSATTEQTSSVATTATNTATATAPEKVGSNLIKPSTGERKAEERKAIQLATSTAQVSNGNRFFSDWTLRSYKLGIAKEAASVDVKAVTNQSDGEGEIAFDLQDYAYVTQVQGVLTSIPNGVQWSYEDQNLKMVRQITAPETQNFADVKVTVDFKGKRPNYAFLSLYQHGSKDDPEAKDRQLLYWTNKSMERNRIEESTKMVDVPTPVRWIGVTNRYFLMSLLVPEGQLEPRALVQPTGPWSARVSMVYPVTSNSITIPLKAYFGPKELSALRAVDPTLDHTVDFGFFTFFAYPLLQVMRSLYDLFHNWGAAIIVLTLLVKLLTYPLTYKSMKSMKEMAKIQPQIKRLQEKHANDKETLNREMMGLMKTHGYNPMAGCLPILVQMPVFFALYNVLYSSIELYHAPFGFWIQDLSAKDPFYITPVLLTGVMFLQQKLQPNTATDPTQQKMMQFMPVIFGVFMINLPAGLTIYMVINAGTSILQQLFLNKKLGGTNVPAVRA